LSHFVTLVTFEIMFYSMSKPAWTTILLFVLPCVAGMRGVCHRTQPLVEMRSWWTFCPGWPWTMILLISAP
jgi:hypothetical protein